MSLEEQRAKGDAALMMAAALRDTTQLHPGEVLLKAGHAAHVLLDRMLNNTPQEGAALVQLEQLVSGIDRAARIAKAALDVDAQDRWVRAQESLVARDAPELAAQIRGLLQALGRDDVEGRKVAAGWLRQLEAGGKP